VYPVNKKECVFDVQ